ncbi:hypothetical protein [Sunxiuqinia dokdonensis]|uniref:Uncharacterized protein n=1 Tax=Sunxiuqinia dokdonensis TaxID=1409788 RepID=A0A0L8V2M4_9BACT|nr:hypothetical protein [Sunxiuqinia dokdonensis]KOH42745.1 hypothetical protein NC99_44710 [Sunxiuqinia dokdonensis]
MEFNEKIKEELESRIRKLENFIADKGIGSKQLNKARNAQRNVNIAVFVGSLIAIGGIGVWAMRRNRNEN